MRRGTTWTHGYTNVPDGIVALCSTYKQGDKIVLEKELDDVALDGNTVVVRLTQAETLLFEENTNMEYQLTVRTTDSVKRSPVFTTSVERALHDGVI